MNSPDLKSVCGCCSIKELCIPAGLAEEEVLLLDQHMNHRRTVRKGDALFRTGDAFRSLYVVSAGLFKTSMLHEDGRTQVTGFQMTGEYLGLDAISSGKHHCEAVALEGGSVCEIAFDQLESLGQLLPNLQHSFHKSLSREIVRDQGVMLLLGSMRAEERLAAFLLNLAKRSAHRRQSDSELILRMTREDIGSYLGLKLETVSRILSRFHDQGLLEVQGRHVRILSSEGLERIIRDH